MASDAATIGAGILANFPGFVPFSSSGSGNGRAIGEARARAREVKQQADIQEEFARNGIRWRVEDAKAAGIHPLAALGAQTTSYQPVQVGGGYDSGPDYRGMGQNIMSSFLNKATQDERTGALADLQFRRAELDVEGEEIRNAILATQFRQMNNLPPPLPSNSGLSPHLLAGQGNSSPTGSGYVTEKPLERIHSATGNPAQEVGEVPDYAYARTQSGLAIVPSKDVKEKIEDQFVPEMSWAARNLIAPNLGLAKPPNPKDYPLPKGYKEWKWDHLTQQYRPSKGRGRFHAFPAHWD